MNISKKMTYIAQNKFKLFLIICASGISFSYYLYCLWIPSEITCVNNPNRNYTYIIVGAGTSGCVLASRLSKNSQNQVLLVEAGGHFNVLSKIPFLAVFLQKSNYDWNYETVPQKWSSTGFYNKKQALSRGKGLGGTNQLNFLIYNGINNQSTWELQDSLLQYLRSKRCLIKSNYLDEILLRNTRICVKKCKPYSSIRIQRTESELGNILKQSLKELNLPAIKYSKGDASIHKGERWSTYRSHLVPAASRKNLHILCNTEVTKIIFKDKRAIGVQLHNNRIIYSESEIIISAGSINTPKLLLLSGLGNEQLLRELNITTIHNLPGVGLNLHDHIAIPIYVEIKEPLSLTLRKVINPIEVFNYAFNKKGIFNSSPVAAFLQSSKNFLILFIGSTPEDPFRTVANYLPETFKNLFPFANDYNHEGFVFLAGCKHTQSRGFVSLNPNKTVVIDPQYFQNGEDVECVKDAMTLVQQLLNTTSFKRIGSKMHLPQLRQCSSSNFTRDAYLKCIIRAAAITMYHQAGTCKMGNDTLAVVDHNFRVKGVTRLRIVDASVLPRPSNNFPNTVITIMAEYVSSLLNI
ncbi:hypothetical protein RN001_004209 [Aquatica leii]|uniref:Glucose-methanol-choline oxidoreductase N-terminal domain-containing protein n=1 Tax=Aquatica leii TaxID=1421715 RepID=A0AAN7SRL4_9COLE|nr:hypothetical protein RN001_004209 [Aquatica leii]